MKFFFFRESNILDAPPREHQARNHAEIEMGQVGRRDDGADDEEAEGNERRGVYRREEEYDKEEHDGISDWKKSKTRGNAVVIPAWDEQDYVAGWKVTVQVIRFVSPLRLK